MSELSLPFDVGFILAVNGQPLYHKKDFGECLKSKSFIPSVET